ncbi:MAG: hypothetical protein OJF62_002098 [Pseudolabrys sp.]|nr:hypothetical protein [Pseudolabrys sp.]
MMPSIGCCRGHTQHAALHAPVNNASKPELPFDRVPPPVAFCPFRELNPDIP